MSEKEGFEPIEVQGLLEEDKKNWPRYVQKRAKTLSSLQNLDFNSLVDLTKKHPDHKSANFVILLANRIDQAKKEEIEIPEIPDELLDGVDIDYLPLHLKAGVARAFYKLGELAYGLDILEEISVSDDPWERSVAATHLGKLGRPSLKILESLSDDEDELVRASVSTALGRIGTPAIKQLLVLVKDNDTLVQAAAAKALYELGEKETATRAFERLSSFGSPLVQSIIAKTTGEISDSAKKQLELLTGNEDPLIRDAAKKALASLGKGDLDKQMLSDSERVRLKKGMILREEPLLASSYFMDGERSEIYMLNEIVSELRSQYPHFIGVAILGSLSRGYYALESDLDYALIYEERDAELVSDFEEAARGLGFVLCEDRSVDVLDVGSQKLLDLEVVFSELFIGDRERLDDVKRNIVENVSSSEWETIRRKQQEHMKYYYRTMERYGFDEDDVLEVIAGRSFLWSLPDLEDVKKLYSTS